MLIDIPLFGFLLFGVTYPLFFWLTADDPIKNNFHRFHLACPVVIGGLSVISLWFLPIHENIRIEGALWLIVGLGLTYFFWNKEKVNPWAITILCVLGVVFFKDLYRHKVQPNDVHVFVCLLSGFLVSSIFYAMNLGHFYLNVHGLKIDHLKNAVNTFGGLLLVRLAWNVFIFCTGNIMYAGQQESLVRFMNSMDGFMIWTGFFFGVVFPLIGLYFAYGTLKLKNTQATTGILYVLLSAVLLGDLAYKYFLFKYQIPM